ncbi:MAG: NADH-quinone oxidoreductase subunit C [Chitinivibrionales bacterium]|nr:NADH-quinone oxidoreductase subunit C [Chitinivibrionales bacterium]
MVLTSRNEVLQNLRERLGNKIVSVFEKNERRIYIEVAPQDIVETTKVIFRDYEARLQTASGVDTPDKIDIYYHWAFDRANCLVTIIVKLDRQKPVIDSIAPLCMGAEWIEREMWELLGVTFNNHPDMRHLLLMDEWPEGQYPLRRDFRLPKKNSPLNPLS